MEQVQTISKPYNWIAIDLETNELDPRKGEILLISITTEEGTYVIDIVQTGLAAFKVLTPLLTESDLVINHNMAFDYKWIVYHTGIEIQNTVCTMVLEQVLTAGLFIPAQDGKPFSLQNIALKRLFDLLRINVYLILYYMLLYHL